MAAAGDRDDLTARLVPRPEPPRPRRCARCCGVGPDVVLAVAVASNVAMLLGYDIGVMSGAKRVMQRDLDLTDRQIETLVGSLNLVSAAGGLLSGTLADSCLGRRGTVAFACLASVAGSVVMALAPRAQGFEVLMVGRTLCGIAVGAGIMIAPLYISELSPKALRGRLVSFFEVAINVGILLGYVAGWGFRTLPDEVSWRWMMGVGGIPPALILLFLCFMPESPRWLLARGREKEASAVLHGICEPAEAEEMLTLMLRESKESPRVGLLTAMSELLCPPPSVRLLLLAGLGNAFFQQATGVEAAVYYTPEVLETAGFTDEDSLLLATVGVGLVKVTVIFVPLLLMDRIGRRPLLIASNVGICLAQLLISMSFLFGPNNSSGGDTPEPEPEPEPEPDIPPLSKWLAVGGQCAFVASFSLGVGPLAHVLSSELYPLRLRGVAVGLATFINRVTSGGIALSFLSLQAALTPAGAFGAFAAVAAVATLFAILVLPETKGRSLEELEQELSEMRLCGSNTTASGGDGNGLDRQQQQVGDSKGQPIPVDEDGSAAAEQLLSKPPGWVSEVERTVGLHSNGGVGMQSDRTGFDDVTR